MTDILLLEDDESVNRGIEFTLQKAGYYVISAFTISQAKQILKQETEISMLICDVNLPDGNGTDLISHIRQTDPDILRKDSQLFRYEYLPFPVDTDFGHDNHYHCHAADFILAAEPKCEKRIHCGENSISRIEQKKKYF